MYFFKFNRKYKKNKKCLLKKNRFVIINLGVKFVILFIF